ncbi:MAG: hypothetical protein ACYST5_06605 [Planctomycetota bacterium]
MSLITHDNLKSFLFLLAPPFTDVPLRYFAREYYYFGQIIITCPHRKAAYSAGSVRASAHKKNHPFVIKNSPVEKKSFSPPPFQDEGTVNIQNIKVKKKIPIIRKKFL